MSKTKRIIIAIIAVVAIVGAAIWYKLATPDTATSPATSSSNNGAASDQPVATTITYDGKAFSLSTDTIASGSTVKITNTSSDELDLDSDPHPTHTNNPELNQGDVPAGTSKTFVLTAKGTWGFHNHLDATQHGAITVQ